MPNKGLLLALALALLSACDSSTPDVLSAERPVAAQDAARPAAA